MDQNGKVGVSLKNFKRVGWALFKNDLQELQGLPKILWQFYKNYLNQFQCNTGNSEFENGIKGICFWGKFYYEIIPTVI